MNDFFQWMVWLYIAFTLWTFPFVFCGKMILDFKDLPELKPEPETGKRIKKAILTLGWSEIYIQMNKIPHDVWDLVFYMAAWVFGSWALVPVFYLGNKFDPSQTEASKRY